MILESFGWIALAALLMWLLPFSRIVRLLGLTPSSLLQSELILPADSAVTDGLARSCQPDDQIPTSGERAAHITRYLDRAGQRIFRNKPCLVTAFAGRMMLHCRGMPSTLILGVTRVDAGSMRAHAWLKSEQYVVTGRRAMASFTPVTRFD